MANNNKEQRKQYKLYNRPILSLVAGLGFLSVILLVMMISAGKDSKYQYNMNTAQSLLGKQVSPTPDPLTGQMHAVVQAIDTANQKITLYDIDQQVAFGLSYNGGTNITDRYGKIMSMSQIETGIMVDATYRKDKNKLTAMNVSAKAWNYSRVNNFTINSDAKTMKIASTLYKYEGDVFVLNDQEVVPITSLTEQDELTVWGYEETIWSITVTRGHGTVVLQDYNNFLGAYITIGYEAIQQITEDMEILVREGDFNLTVDNGEYTATKNITVNRNQKTYVSLSDLGPAASQIGSVVFEITPLGADLAIDDVLVSYANPVDLEYGDHSIKVSMGGYTTYNGTLTVDSAGKTIKIDLPESSSDDEVAVTETDNSDSTDTSNTGNTGTDTDNTGSTENIDNSDNTDDTNAGSDSTITDSSNSNDTSDNSEDIDAAHLIYVQKPVGASVYIDGKYKCTAPGSFKKVIGSHVITFIKDGYKTMSYTIEVEDDNQDTYYSFADLAKE